MHQCIKCCQCIDASFEKIFLSIPCKPWRMVELTLFLIVKGVSRSGDACQWGDDRPHCVYGAVASRGSPFTWPAKSAAACRG